MTARVIALTGPLDVSRHASFGELVSALLHRFQISKARLAEDEGVNINYLYKLTEQNIKCSQRAAQRIISAIEKEADVSLDVEKILGRYGYVTTGQLNASNFNSSNRGDWLRLLRHRCGLSQEQTGQIIGVPKTAVSEHERRHSILPKSAISAAYQQMFLGLGYHKRPYYFTLDELIRRTYPTLSLCESFGATIRTARNNLGRTQQDLSREVGIIKSHLERIELDWHSPSHETARALADILEPAFLHDFTSDDFLEKFGYATKRSLHPRRYGPYDLPDWLLQTRNFSIASRREFGHELGREASTIAAYEKRRIRIPEEMAGIAYDNYILSAIPEGDPDHFSRDEVEFKFVVTPKLIAENLPAVMEIAAQRASREGSSFHEDINDIAIIALLRAIEDKSDHPSFQSYARTTARLGILSYLNGDSSFRVTDEEEVILERVTQAREVLRQGGKVHPTFEAIAGMLGNPRLPALAASSLRAESQNPLNQDSKVPSPAGPKRLVPVRSGNTRKRHAYNHRGK